MNSWFRTLSIDYIGETDPDQFTEICGKVIEIFIDNGLAIESITDAYTEEYEEDEDAG